MGGRYWKMTENGLTRLNCPKQTEEIIRTKNGIHVNDKDAKVKVDEHGIELHSDLFETLIFILAKFFAILFL